MKTFSQIYKRDGTLAPFDKRKIEIAIEKAMRAAKEYSREAPSKVADSVIETMLKTSEEHEGLVPTVEGVQNEVERQLIMHKFPQTAKSYILYRKEHERLREEDASISDETRRAVAESKKYFSNQLSEFLFYSTYSRWIDEKGRRESWAEAVDRYVGFMKENLGNKLDEGEYEKIHEFILSMKALGSMRLLWSSGKAARTNNIAGYNCAFIAPSCWRDFGEIMYVLMSGTGAGFSVERQTVEMLPIIERQEGEKLSTFEIPDSREGWAEALRVGMETWSGGKDIDFDYGKIRPRGARLHTMGGRASGPEPLKNLLEFTREKMLSRQGRHLTTLDVHDIVTKIGEIVVAGGVRRSALISLSDVDDSDMRDAKNGQFYVTHPHRSMANNSAVYNEKPTMKQFIDEWFNLVRSGSGERGIFNRGGLKQQMPARRWKTFKKDYWKSGLNPCGEIYLKSKQFCNLSEVVARPEDTEDTLMEKVRIATILGTYQATLTDFPYLSKDWKRNSEEEALLGVSITSQWDCKAVRNPLTMRKLKEVAVETNRVYAKRFGIQSAGAVTCVKPSGNGSQLFNCSSGMHPRHAPFYVRRVRIESHNPLFKLLRDEGVPYHPEVGQSDEQATTYVLEFPIASPKDAVVKDDITAIEHLKYWKLVKENYTEHNPSVTVSVEEDEWLKVGSWVYSNWNLVGGLSFLPKSEHIYQLAPYEEITEEKYKELIRIFPEIDFSKLSRYEKEDMTVGAKEYACMGGVCETDEVTTAEIA